MTIGEWVARASELIARQGSEARLEAQCLAAHAHGQSRSWLLAHTLDPVNEAVAEQLLKRRLNREPLAYILGAREFYGRTFEVGPGVLIPRQETETLIEVALQHAAADSVIADIGTGSGCIAITLALELPQCKIIATDNSPEALAIARRNGQRLAPGRVEFIECDLVDGIADHRCNLVVSNPPYIAQHEPLEPEIADWEPASALYADDNGYAVYDRLLSESVRVLGPQGGLLLEIGDHRSGIMSRAPTRFWEHIETRNDLDKNPRALLLRLKN